MSFCNDCCDVFGNGERIIEKKIVELDYSISDDFSKKYPYVNSPCGCGLFNSEPNCEETFQYRYKSISADYESVVEWSDPDFIPKGGTELYSSSDPSYEDLEPDYYSCECKQTTEAILNCTESCEAGEKRDNHKFITTSISANTGFTPCSNTNGCVASEGVEQCFGVIGPEDPRLGNLTSGSCTYSRLYQRGDGDPDYQDVTLTYSDRVDMFNLPWNTGLEKLEEIEYPNIWDDTQDCTKFWQSGWIPNDIYNGVTVDFSTFKYRNFVDEYTDFPCETAQPSIGQHFKKVKFRWRFSIPSSCYIKIWICRYNVKQLLKSDINVEYPLDFIIENESIESHVIEISSTNEKCFDGLKECGEHELSHAVSQEFELISPSIEFPEEEPSFLYNAFTQLTKIKGISIIGLSYVDGWEPPLFKYSEDVWKSLSLKANYAISPYWMPDTINRQQFKKGLFWPNTPEKTQEAIDYFNNVINVVDAP